MAEFQASEFTLITVAQYGRNSMLQNNFKSYIALTNETTDDYSQLRLSRWRSPTTASSKSWGRVDAEMPHAKPE